MDSSPVSPFHPRPGIRFPHCSHQHLHVVPRVAFHFGRAEQVRGMVGHDDLDVAVGVELAP